MTTAEFIDKVGLADLIFFLNTIEDPFSQRFDFIGELTDERLEQIAEYESVWWLIDAVNDCDSRFDSEDEYLLCNEEGHYTFTFSTKEELVEHIGRDNLIELVDENKDDYDEIPPMMNRYEPPCEINGFEL